MSQQAAHPGSFAHWPASLEHARFNVPFVHMKGCCAGQRVASEHSSFPQGTRQDFGSGVSVGIVHSRKLQQSSHRGLNFHVSSFPQPPAASPSVHTKGTSAPHLRRLQVSSEHFFVQSLAQALKSQHSVHASGLSHGVGEHPLRAGPSTQTKG